MGSGAGQDYFGQGNDFANYQGESLWSNPYANRTPLDWARAEYGQFGDKAFPMGVHPDYDFAPGIALGETAAEHGPFFTGSKDEYGAVKSEIQRANLLFSDDPSMYWSHYMRDDFNLPDSPFAVPQWLPPWQPPRRSGSENVGVTEGRFGAPGSGLSQLGLSASDYMRSKFDLGFWDSAFAVTGPHRRWYEPGGWDAAGGGWGIGPGAGADHAQDTSGGWSGGGDPGFGEDTH